MPLRSSPEGQSLQAWSSNAQDTLRLAWRRVAGLRPGSARWFLYTYLSGSIKRRPVFVVGVPRSGTTSLLVALNASNHLGAPPAESHAVWLAFHHPRRIQWASGAIGAGSVRRGEARFVKAYFGSHARHQRVLDKTPANALRLPHILELFPDAHIVIMRRNPCDVISSIIKGWQVPDKRFGAYVLPNDLRIPDYDGRRLWNFALPPGWEELVGQPLREVAFAQWQRLSSAIDAARSSAPPTSRWTHCYLEHMVENPDATMTTLCESIDIPLERTMKGALAAVSRRPLNALSAPAIGKWRYENPQAIGELLPRISEASGEYGYAVDPDTGDFRVTGTMVPGA